MTPESFEEQLNQVTTQIEEEDFERLVIWFGSRGEQRVQERVKNMKQQWDWQRSTWKNKTIFRGKNG